MGADQLVQQYTSSAAHAATQAAGSGLQSLLGSFFAGTEPNFGTIATTYNRMLAIALLLAGAMIAMALVERLLGGPRGAGWSVVPRALAATSGAVLGLGLVQYAAGYANLLAHAWDLGFAAHGLDLATKIQATYQNPLTQNQALGSAIGLLLLAFLTILLVVLITIELVLRSALILITTAFIPLVCVMAIWPRLTPALTHLVEFLTALLLSKFVIITAVFIGFTMVADGYGAPAGDAGGSGAMVVGIAALLIALFSPVVLLQGIRFSHTAAASAVRSWGATGSRGALIARPMAARLRSAGSVARQRARAIKGPRRRSSTSPRV